MGKKYLGIILCFSFLLLFFTPQVYAGLGCGAEHQCGCGAEYLGTCYINEYNGWCCCRDDAWTAWSACSKTCGSGIQSRTNDCGYTQTQSCNTQPCITNTPIPTNTPVPTNTPIPTNTPAPTEIPIPTAGCTLPPTCLCNTNGPRCLMPWSQEFCPCETVITPIPIETMQSCNTDTDCGCGMGTQTGECGYLNNKYLGKSCPWPDFCTGFSGNCKTSCVKGKCTQVCPTGIPCGFTTCKPGQECFQPTMPPQPPCVDGKPCVMYDQPLPICRPKPNPTCEPPPACVYAFPPCALQLAEGANICNDGTFKCGSLVCKSGQECYQPPMPLCPVGMACPQVMPTPYCKEKECYTPPDCMNADHPCEIAIPAGVQMCQKNCLKQSQGDANCDNKIDKSDYTMWKSFYIGAKAVACQNCTGDFNKDGKTDLLDFEVLRWNLFDPTNVQTNSSANSSFSLPPPR